MAELKGTKTHETLSTRSPARARRTARLLRGQADIEGLRIAGLPTRPKATGHAHGHMDYLKAAGDPPRGFRSARRS